MSEFDAKVANLQINLAAARQDYRRLEALVRALAEAARIFVHDPDELRCDADDRRLADALAAVEREIGGE